MLPPSPRRLNTWRLNELLDGVTQFVVEHRGRVPSQRKRVWVATNVRERKDIHGLILVDLDVTVGVGRHYLAEKSLDR